MKRCALCNEIKELQLSHIIPKFVGRYLKNTSIGDIRIAENPNDIIQDTEKYYLLCHDCEERFSKTEKYFADNVFYPFKNKNQKEFEYDKRLFYFITSLSWRSLYLDICEHVKNGDWNLDILETMISAEKTMREFLLDNRKDIGNIEHHILFFDEMIENLIFEEQRMFETVNRSLISYTHFCENNIFTISNLTGVIIITFYKKEVSAVWSQNKIMLNGGILLTEGQSIDKCIAAELIYWAQLCENAKNNLNDKSRERIEKRFNELGDEIQNSSIFREWVKDIDLEK